MTAAAHVLHHLGAGLVRAARAVRPAPSVPAPSIPANVLIAYRAVRGDEGSAILVVTQEEVLARLAWRGLPRDAALLAFMAEHGAWTTDRLDGRMDARAAYRRARITGGTA